MAKWTLPEGRKPLTDADMAALTRRLADTVIEQSELYQAAKRDAEEAEAYAAEVEKERDMSRAAYSGLSSLLLSVQKDCITAEAKLAKAREALQRISLGSQNSMTTKEALGKEARAALAEIGEGHE